MLNGYKCKIWSLGERNTESVFESINISPEWKQQTKRSQNQTTENFIKSGTGKGLKAIKRALKFFFHLAVYRVRQGQLKNYF